MTGKPLPLLILESDDPTSRGHEHGETYRQAIKEIAEIRLERMCKVSQFSKKSEVLELAEKHLPVLKNFAPDLFLEFYALAQSSTLSLAELVVLNHYTDLRDIESSPSLADNGGCSIIYSPTPKGPVLGQTWDIHGSAMPYGLVIRLKDALVFSITGCLGMTGINKHGLAVAINNLASIDAQVGVLWPAVIRKILQEKTARAAQDLIMGAHLGSGRHFALADGKDFIGIEASGTKKKIVWDKANELYFHTNHCLDEEMRKTHTVSKESTTYWRYQQLDEVVRFHNLSSPEKIFLALAHVSLPLDRGDIHKTATCATFVMDIHSRSTLGCSGIAHSELLHDPATRMSL